MAPKLVCTRKRVREGFFPFRCFLNSGEVDGRGDGEGERVI